MTRPVPLQGEEREKHLEMMQTHTLWPMYPLLPLINRSETNEEGFAIPGIISCLGPRPFEVMLITLHQLPVGVKSWDEFYQAAPTKKYDSYEAMLDDGWVVD